MYYYKYGVLRWRKIMAWTSWLKDSVRYNGTVRWLAENHGLHDGWLNATHYGFNERLAGHHGFNDSWLDTMAGTMAG